MKDNRASAFNWACVSFVVVGILYGIFACFGEVPPLTIGGYGIATPVVDSSGNALHFIVPKIGSLMLLVVVPLCVFGLKYVWEIAMDFGLEDVRGDHRCVSAVFLGVAICFSILREPFHVYVSLYFLWAVLVITVYVIGVFMYKVMDYPDENTFTFLMAGLFFTGNVINILLHSIFFTSYHLEWMLFFPGIVVVLFLMTLMIFTSIPFVIALMERLWAIVRIPFTETFWKKVDTLLSDRSKL